jgi:hypothetical protein
MEKRLYMSGFNIDRNSSKNKLDKEILSNTDNINQVPKEKISKITSSKPNENFTASLDNSDETVTNKYFSETPKINEKRSNVIVEKSELTPLSPADDCDVIVLKNGQEISVKVVEVGQTEIKYKMCDNLNGPTFTKNKSEVLKIKYPNGSTTIIETKKTEQNSLIGFVLSLLIIPSMIITIPLGLVFSIVSVIFSAIGLMKFKKEPTKWKGKGFAIAGLVIGILFSILLLAGLASMF